MATTLKIQTRSGTVDVPTVWAGDHLAVHRPVLSNGRGLSKESRHWAITHRRTGLAACPSFDGPRAVAVKLARLWDEAFSYVTHHGDAKGWPLAAVWQRDLTVAQYGTSEPTGPVLPTLENARTYGDLQDAAYRAMGYEPVAEPEASDQYPADVTKNTDGAGAVRRNPETGILEYCWLPQGGNYPFSEAISLRGWYPVPSVGDVETWCLGSTAETPCGDTVEPDHPDAWPRLLGLI